MSHPVGHVPSPWSPEGKEYYRSRRNARVVRSISTRDDERTRKIGADMSEIALIEELRLLVRTETARYWSQRSLSPLEERIGFLEVFLGALAKATGFESLQIPVVGRVREDGPAITDAQRGLPRDVPTATELVFEKTDDEAMWSCLQQAAWEITRMYGIPKQEQLRIMQTIRHNLRISQKGEAEPRGSGTTSCPAPKSPASPLSSNYPRTQNDCFSEKRS